MNFIPKYEDLNIPEIIRQHLPEEKEFLEIIHSCFEERPLEDDDPCTDEGYEFYDEECIFDSWAVDKITDIAIEMIQDGRTLERDITVQNLEEFLADVKGGQNGLGLSWSYTSGKAVEGGEDDRYLISMTAKILDSSAINYMGTYCHEQYDISLSLNPDEEIMLKEGGKAQLLSISLHDRVAGLYKTIDFDNLVVKVSDL